MGEHWADTAKSVDHVRDIQEALSDYRTRGYEFDQMPETLVFTPTRVLYAAYLRALPRVNPKGAPVSEVIFGRALRPALGVELRALRRYKGKLVWGYLGVEGPGCITVQTGRGRRRGSKNVHKAAAPAAEVQSPPSPDPGQSPPSPLPPQ